MVYVWFRRTRTFQLFRNYRNYNNYCRTRQWSFRKRPSQVFPHLKIFFFNFSFRLPGGLQCRRDIGYRVPVGQSARIVGGAIATRNAWNFIAKIKICKFSFNLWVVIIWCWFANKITRTLDLFLRLQIYTNSHLWWNDRQWSLHTLGRTLLWFPLWTFKNRDRYRPI